MQILGPEDGATWELGAAAAVNNPRHQLTAMILQGPRRRQSPASRANRQRCVKVANSPAPHQISIAACCPSADHWNRQRSAPKVGRPSVEGSENDMALQTRATPLPFTRNQRGSDSKADSINATRSGIGGCKGCCLNRSTSAHRSRSSRPGDGLCALASAGTDPKEAVASRLPAKRAHVPLTLARPPSPPRCCGAVR